MMYKAKKQDAIILKYEGREVLVLNENSLDGYNNFIVDKLIKYSELPNQHQGNRSRVLDFGAGIGTLADIWFTKRSERIDCLEIDKAQSEVISKKGFRIYNSLDSIDVKYNFIFTSNVLEHIDDDKATITQLQKLLHPNGRIAIYVPAFMLLFSELDEAVGHYRRYSMKEIKEKVLEADLRVIHVQYVDSLGFLASLLVRIIGYKSHGNLGGSRSLEFYDRFVFPLSRMIDFCGVRYFLGKNIFLVAEKISTPQ